MGTLGKITGRVPEVLHEKPREGDVMHSRADIRLAGSVLGYRPSVKLEDGLREMLRKSGRGTVRRA